MSDGHLLIRAARGEPVDRAPVWAMRQAGRWDPQFSALRTGHSFYEFSENVELAARASLCPRRFGVDAIILFYDITTLTVAMGQPFQLVPEVGPVPDFTVTSTAALDKLAARPSPERYKHVIELLHAVKRELAGELPVLVFAGAPFTLATYSIGVGKDIGAVRRFAAKSPSVWSGLLEKLSGATVEFLNTLIAEGADAYQLFDSWAGKLDEDEYDQWAQRHQRDVFASASGVPGILFVKDCPHIDAMTQSGADVVSLGASHDLAALLARFPNQVFQGNVSDRLLVEGTPDQVIAATQECLRQSGGQRHILNLGHGMNRDAKPENFAAFVATGRSYSVASGCR